MSAGLLMSLDVGRRKMLRQCLCEKLVKVSLKSVYCSAKIIGSNLFFCYQSIMSLMTVFDMTINGLAWLGVRFDMMMELFS